MAQQITKEELQKLMVVTASNFKFKMPEGFELIFEMIFNKIKEIDRSIIQKKFEQLLLTPNEEWNKKYGFAGYPSLSDWLAILTTERPLTDEQIQEEKRKYNQAMTLYVGTIINWLNDPNIEYLFLNKYLAGGNEHLKSIVNQFAGVKEPLTDERIVKMGKYLKKLYDDDKNAFITKMLGITKEQNKFRFLEVTEPQQKQINFLPTLKKI